MATEEVQNQDVEVEDFTDDRAAQIEAMAEKYEQRVAADMEEKPAEPDEAPEEEPEEPEESTEEPEEPEEEPQERRFKVKVDGEEREVTEAEMVASYQMQQAAERRLADAREVLAEVKALRAESQKPKEQPKTADEIQKSLAALSKKALEATDEDEFAAVELEKAQLYREMFKAEMAERERAHQLEQDHHVLQEKHNALKAQVAEKHPDFEAIMWAGQDQTGNKIVQPRLEQWLATQPASTRWALFASEDPSDPISVFDRYKADTGLVKVQSMEERTARKQKLDTLPTAERKATPPKTEQKEETGSDIVRQMRKERGMLADEDL
jgi:hypothetical protein